MRRYWKIGLALVIGLLIGLAISNTISAHSAAKTSVTAPSEPTIAQLLTLVNAERAKNGVAPLKEDVRLDASAQMKAQDEVTYNYFGHISPHDGKQGYLYINDVGINCKTDSENISRGNDGIPTAKQVVDGWINSPPHHQAMIDPRYTLTGFGIDQNQVVEHFCQQ